MIKRHVWLIAVFAFATACSDSLGPGVTGRWAATGIELLATNGVVELRLPCASPFHAPRFIRFTGEPIEFSGRVGSQWSYDFTFRGQLVRDTLVATLLLPVPNRDPTTINYRMTPDGDSGLDRQVCLAGAKRLSP